MSIAEKEAVPTYFGQSFRPVDEEDADSAGFQAPKKENRWALLELEKDQLELLESGQSFRIQEHSMSKGSTAFCTPTATYGLEFLENSNPMYIGNVHEVVKPEAAKAPEPTIQGENKENDGSAPNAAGGTEAQSETAAAGDPAAKEESAAALAPATAKTCTIFAQCRGHLFLKPLTGDVQRLRDLLAPQAIDGAPEGAEGQQSQGMSTSSLQYQVAASPKELQEFLEKGPYYERDGTWCWLPAAFEREVTDVALNLLPSTAGTRPPSTPSCCWARCGSTSGRTGPGCCPRRPSSATPCAASPRTRRPRRGS